MAVGFTDVANDGLDDVGLDVGDADGGLGAAAFLNEGGDEQGDGGDAAAALGFEGDGGVRVGEEGLDGGETEFGEEVGALPLHAVAGGAADAHQSDATLAECEVEPEVGGGGVSGGIAEVVGFHGVEEKDDAGAGGVGPAPKAVVASSAEGDKDLAVGVGVDVGACPCIVGAATGGGDLVGKGCGGKSPAVGMGENGEVARGEEEIVHGRTTATKDNRPQLRVIEKPAIFCMESLQYVKPGAERAPRAVGSIGIDAARKGVLNMYRIGREELEEIGKVIAAKKLFMVGDPATGHQQEVVRFEHEWAAKIGVKHALCLNGGGTAGLMCGLAALGIGPGDEVIVPGYTFMASASAVLAVGAIPVIAEVDETCLIDPVDVERKMGPAVKAIIPVHMVGMPCNMDAIMAVARKHGVRVAEDSCQCDGGSYKGRRTGSIGEVGAFSFNDFKIMTCGEGGAMVTNDRALYERALVYSDSGSAFRPYAKDLAIAPFLGLQFRPSEIQGAILRMQLQKLEGMLADLRRIKGRIMAELKGKAGVRFAPSNDLAGDCGVVTAFQFENNAKATAFAKSEGVGGWLPINTGKHVYYNWTPIFEKRIGHHPEMNPFNHPKNRGLRTEYRADMCPKTTDILGRTVFVSLNPDWTEAQVVARIAACEKAAKATA